MQTAKASRKQSSLSGKESAQGCLTVHLFLALVPANSLGHLLPGMQPWLPIPALQISPLREGTDAPNSTQVVQGSTPRQAPGKWTSGLKEELAFPEGLFSPGPAGWAGGCGLKRPTRDRTDTRDFLSHRAEAPDVWRPEWVGLNLLAAPYNSQQLRMVRLDKVYWGALPYQSSPHA